MDGILAIRGHHFFCRVLGFVAYENGAFIERSSLFLVFSFKIDLQAFYPTRFYWAKKIYTLANMGNQNLT